MECPRCGNELERYTLEDREAVTCGACGYVGVPVEHRGDPRSFESWDEAISRYPDATRIQSVTVETVDELSSIEIVLGPVAESTDRPDPTVVRVRRPDPALAAALEAADGADERFVCDICGREFDAQKQLYGHLAVHSGETESDSDS